MKKLIIGLSLTLMSVFGVTAVAHAETQSAEPTQKQEQVRQDDAANAPSGYEEFGFGEVKADGQWVNDN